MKQDITGFCSPEDNQLESRLRKGKQVLRGGTRDTLSNSTKVYQVAIRYWLWLSMLCSLWTSTFQLSRSPIQPVDRYKEFLYFPPLFPRACRDSRTFRDWNPSKVIRFQETKIKCKNSKMEPNESEIGYKAGQSCNLTLVWGDLGVLMHRY